jgi:hypothetical protein
MKLGQKLAAFVRSPRGQQLAGQARQFAAKPENQRKLAQLRNRLTKRHH